jgi:hypothetical protein
MKKFLNILYRSMMLLAMAQDPTLFRTFTSDDIRSLIYGD